MLPPVYATLAADSGATDLLGDPPRVWRHGEAPQDGTRPYVTWNLVAGVPENTLSEGPGVDRCTIQIDCWSPTSAAVVVLAEAVRDAVEPLAHMTGVVVDERERATKLYHLAMQFDWWLSR
jgi:hypothetical protein